VVSIGSVTTSWFSNIMLCLMVCLQVHFNEEKSSNFELVYIASTTDGGVQGGQQKPGQWKADVLTKDVTKKAPYFWKMSRGKEAMAVVEVELDDVDIAIYVKKTLPHADNLR